MEVILIENVDNLGARRQIVKVADGYGRNHLLPKKLAIAATPQNRKWVEQQRQKFLKQEAQERDQAGELAKLLEGLRLVFTRKAGEQGTLFGSVTTLDIAEQLTSQGYNIDRRKIHLSNPLKTIGEHEVPIRLHREVTAKIKVAVEAEGQAEAQAEQPAKAEASATPAEPQKESPKA
ncbi:MAG TPA: 50S ribosomal protein L9 [Terriglobia bacterium]|nr:50S ribosomal protein L9 [Terriglobia bacterium]